MLTDIDAGKIEYRQLHGVAIWLTFTLTRNRVEEFAVPNTLAAKFSVLGCIKAMKDTLGR